LENTENKFKVNDKVEVIKYENDIDDEDICVGSIGIITYIYTTFKPYPISVCFDGKRKILGFNADELKYISWQIKETMI